MECTSEPRLRESTHVTGRRTIDDQSEHRITELEVKVAFQENLLQELDGVIRTLRDELDVMGRAIAELREQVDGSSGEVIDEKPPHY